MSSHCTETGVLRLTRSSKIYYCAPSYSCPVHKQPRVTQPGDIQQHRDSLAIGSRASQQDLLATDVPGYETSAMLGEAGAVGQSAEQLARPSVSILPA